jgi:hypothetical protein
VPCLIEAPKRNKLHRHTFHLLDVSQMTALHHSTNKSIECPAQSRLHSHTSASSLLPLPPVRVSAREPRGASPFPWVPPLCTANAQHAVDALTNAEAGHVYCCLSSLVSLSLSTRLSTRPSTTGSARRAIDVAPAHGPTHPQPSTYSLPLQTSNLSLLTHPPLSYQPLLSLLHPPPHLHLFRLDLSPLLLAPFLMSPTLRSNSAVIVHRLSESESWWKPWLLSLLPRNGHSFVPGRELIVVC